MKKIIAVLVALGLTSVFAAEAAKADANKTEKKVEKKAKKEKNATKAEANKTK